MTQVVRENVIVSGDVQGVGFRYRAVWAAQRLGVTGWVRNLYDGRVEMELQGTRADIEMMLAELEEMRFVEIRDMERREVPAADDEYGFRVRSDG